MAKEATEPKKMETTEAYRDELREFRNVDRLMRSANDNKEGASARKQKKPRQGEVFDSNSQNQRKSRITQSAKVAIKGARTIRAGSAWWMMASITGGFIYPFQVCFAILNLIGLLALVGFNDSILGYLDFLGYGTETANVLFFTSMVVVFLTGIITLGAAVVIFLGRKVNVARGMSIIVAPLCLVLYLAPILNLFPWAWLWGLYVVKSQVND